MTPRSTVRLLGGLFFALVGLIASAAPSLMENLNRGVVAVRTSATDVFIGWRILGTDPTDVSFDLYRSTDGAAPVKLNGARITGGTNLTDATADLTKSNAYHVVAYIYGVEQPASEVFTLDANAAQQQYLRIALQRPAGGTNPSGSYTYSPNDCSVGDVDGDGQYEIFVKWDPSNSKDNSQSGYTGNVYLDCYRLNGTRLWRIDLGINIRAGAHYTQFMVYDLDGDGKAELACKTAPGSKDGTGANILMGSDDAAADYRNSSGYVLSGPEYLTIFNGLTGANMATVAYNPGRGTVSNWGDSYGNRVDRFLAGVAYLDGQRPSLVMCRGYYTRAAVAAWDWRNGVLSQRWFFDTGFSGGAYPDYKGQGAHSLTIGDVDGDGKDEITYGACAIDDNGTGLYTTKLGHGDALHMSDMDPDRPGLEVWMVHEDPGSYGPNAAEFRDARTGELIWGVAASGDIGRGLAIDVDPRYRGYEMWGSSATGGMYTAKNSTPNAANGPRGVQIATGKGSINFACWWDGDLLRELLDGTGITKWNWLSNNSSTLLAPSGIGSNNSTKATPNLSADILGDWREEVIWRESTDDALRIYTTTIPTTHRIHTLMHDRQYRCAIAWQNTAYNQPPHPSFYLGDGMAPVTPPDIVTSLGVLLGPVAPFFTAISNDTGSSSSDQITNDNTVVIHGTAPAGATVSLLRTGFGPIGSTTADGNGDWSFDYSGTALPNGTHSFIGTSTVAGQSGPSSVPWSITIDTTPPLAPTIANISGSDPLFFDGTSESDNTVIVTRVGGGQVASVVSAGTGLWAAVSEESGLPAGAYSFTAQAFDLAGNASPISAPAAVDTSVVTPMIVSLENDTGPSDTDGITSDNTIVLHGTGSAGNTVSIYRLGIVAPVGTAPVNGAGEWTFDYSATVLPDDAYLFYATATNGSGASPNSDFFSVVIDTTPPTIVSINRSNPITELINTTSVTFTVNYSESVLGIDATDFALLFGNSATGSISNVSEADAASTEVTIGSLAGEGSIRLNGVAAPSIIDAAGNPLTAAFTTGQIYTRVLNGNGVWLNTAGGFWGDNPNWLNSIFPAASGQSADFNTLNLTADIDVLLDAPRTAGSLIFGDTDTTSAGGWNLSDNGSPANILTLAGTPTITVNALGTGKVATVDATIAGNQGLTKNGAGTLVLAGTNSFTGTFNVFAGTVRVPANATINTGSGAVNATTAANATINVTGGTFTAGGMTTAGSGTSASSVAGIFRVDSGTVALNGGFRTGNESGSQLRVTGGTVTTASVNIGRNGGATADFASGFVVTGGATTVTGTVILGSGNSTGAMSVEGGSVLVNGAITVANQSSASRGGAMRVTGGTFTSTDTASGIVLSKVNGSNANNIAAATFSGGTSTVEKIQLGFDSAVNAGTATVTVSGGTLYLGSGGILKNGTSGLVSTIALTSGTLGAKSDWSTTHPVTLSSGGTISVRAADAAGTARTITLGGVVSGTGTLTKTGTGTLILSSANTYTGATTVNQGILRVSGSVANTAVAINTGGTLAGTGSFGGAVTFNGGGKLAFDLASGLPMTITGALTKGSAGTYALDVSASSSPTVGTTYTLANFASTTFALGDFTVTQPSGVLGHVLLSAGSLKYIVTGMGASAEFTDWAYLAGLAAGNNGANNDPDGDGVKNLLEFLLATDPLHGDATGLTPIVVNVSGTDYPAVSFRRRQVVGGVTSEVQASADLAWGTLIPTSTVSVTNNGDGTDTVIVRSTVTIATNPKQFFRLQATLP